MSETFIIRNQYGEGVTHYVPTAAADVTDTIADAVLETADAWYPEGPIEWDDVWDRMEGQEMDGLPDGATRLSWGDQIDTPAMRKAQRYVRKVRSQG